MGHPIAALTVAVAALATLSGCGALASPPATRALENGAADRLDSARSFELKGTYADSAGRWSVDLQIARPAGEHIVIDGPLKLEAILIGGTAYFRGQTFLAQHMGTDPLSQQKVRAAGNSWWKGSAGDAPRLPEFTDGGAFKSTFLGAIASRRTDNVFVDGSPAVDLSGVRADVYIASTAPYEPLRVKLNKNVVIDAITDADLRFMNFDANFSISPPADVIDFSDLSTLPPIYYVMSIDTSGCASPCALSALLKNIGGTTGATAPSMVDFVVTDAASGKVAGSCSARVTPDVGYNATTTVSCAIGNLNGEQLNAAIVTVTVDNPGRA